MLSRRQLLRGAVVTVAGAALPAVLAACGGTSSTATATTGTSAGTSSTSTTAASTSAATSAATTAASTPMAAATTAAATPSTSASPVAVDMGTLGNPSKAVTLVETGSSLLYPLFNAWAPAIHQQYSNITVQTASTGSGTGIAQAVAGVAQFGGTDAYMSDAQLKTAPPMANIPLCISAQQVNYNVPEVTTPLKLSGPILAAIYQGTIKYWDDAQIASANSGVTLPHQAIIPVHRTDGSGDTFIFTQYLSFSTPDWQTKVGFGTSVNFPGVAGALGAVGNPGVLQTVSQTKYSLGYIGSSFLNQAQAKGLGTALLLNKAGNYVPIQTANITAAASAMVPQTPKDERISLIFAPGADSYPIINYEYVAVQTKQSDPDIAQSMRTVLAWAISTDGGNASSFLDPVHFLPLPSSVLPLSQAQIAAIQ